MTTLELVEQYLISYFTCRKVACDSIIDNRETLIVYIEKASRLQILAMSEICVRHGVEWDILPSIQQPERVAIWITEQR